MSEVVKFEFEIISEDYLNAGSVSSEIKKYLNQIGINQKLTRRIAISSYEAEINLIIHSMGGKLILEISGEEINLISTDVGPGIKNIDEAMTPGFTTANERARELGFGAGMGLPNMKKNSDVFIINSNQVGTYIKMTYKI